MRAVLIVNPAATTTTGKTREVIVSALASELKVEVADTRHRGHAVELAADAAADGVDLVVALGGDGTVNEVVNGLLRHGPAPDGPTLAVVPGGSTNVVSRALGSSRDPVEATAELLSAVRAGRSRRISLGRADDRWFVFTAGFGFDADVVRRVEALRARGRTSTPGRYVRAAATSFYRTTARWNGPIQVERPDAPDRDGFFLAIVNNVSPWTYLGDRAITLVPGDGFDGDLDLFALRRIGAPRLLGQLVRALRGREPKPGRGVEVGRGLTELTLRATRPTALQVDGDDAGDHLVVHLQSVPNALRVMRP